MGLIMVRRKGRQKGSLLIESIIGLGLLAYLLTGYALSSATAHRVVATQVSNTVATQAVAAYVEKLRATPWSQVGITGTAGDVSLLPAGTTPVINGAVQPVTTQTVRGLTLTLHASIGWQKAPLDGTAYGVKSVVVQASWTDQTSAGSPHTVTRDDVITPGIDQAAPSGVRGGS